MLLIAKEFIDEFKIHSDCILHNTQDSTVCQYIFPLLNSEIDKTHLVNATIHFLSHPTTSQNIMILWTDSVYNIHNLNDSIKKDGLNLIINQIKEQYGSDSAYIDDDGDIRVRLFAQNVNVGKVREATVNLTQVVSRISSVLYDYCMR